jgi:formylglycine-generating enzyme required for sulfatase activity
MLIAFKLKLALACVAGLAGPAKRWIANYERENARDTGSATRPFDAFGVNENGLSDLAGKVWEWTATCFDRSVLDEGGRAVKTNSNCGVRIAEGAHRAYITDFIRDARAGGCAAGTPPAISASARCATSRHGRIRSPRGSARPCRSDNPDRASTSLRRSLCLLR